MLVLSMSGTGDWSAPGGGSAGMSGVAGGRDAALVRVFPGDDTQELAGAKLPGDDAGASVPVLLPPSEPRINTGIAGARTCAVVTGLMAEPGARFPPKGLSKGIAVAETFMFVDVTLATDGESSSPAPEQFKLVPGMVGSCANGGVDKVVAGAPGTVAAEKRLV